MRCPQRIGDTPRKLSGLIFAPSAFGSAIVFGEADPPLALSAQVERVVLNALDTHAALTPNISAPLAAVWLPIHLSVRMHRQPKVTLRLLHTNQQPPDSAECNSSLLKAECHVRQFAADDRNIPPARTLRFRARMKTLPISDDFAHRFIARER